MERDRDAVDCLGRIANELAGRCAAMNSINEKSVAEFLNSSSFIDSVAPAVSAYAHQQTAGIKDDRDRALALYRAVRDGIRYDLYIDYTDAANFRASGVLAAGRGFCVGKAALLAAACRAVGIPARVGYADVRNHMTSPRLHALTQTDVFFWHAYADLYIDGTWVKSTPAFDRELCLRVGMPPLEFDGRSDSLFQELDSEGRRRMEYLQDRGTFADVPFDTILAEFRKSYPGLIAATQIGGNFREEARPGRE
jgi:transglutaminase-like putative cysteine protease